MAKDALIAKAERQELEEEGDASLSPNLFKPLAEDARRTLRKIMLNTDNQKLAASVAESILDRAGEGKRQEAVAPGIVISESQVNLLVQAQKEAFS